MWFRLIVRRLKNCKHIYISALSISFFTTPYGNSEFQGKIIVLVKNGGDVLIGVACSIQIGWKPTVIPIPMSTLKGLYN